MQARTQRHSTGARLARFAVATAGLAVLERLGPGHARAQPGIRRVLQNSALGLLSLAVMLAVEEPLVRKARAWTARHRLSLLDRVDLPPPLATVLAFAWMDYSQYWWHWATHRVPALWRLHAVHHSDADLDVFTSFRFHALEMLAGVPFRVVQVAAFGVPPPVALLWQQAFFSSVFLHHSNLELPPSVERRARHVFITPTLHRIHHSQRSEERDGNWSTGVTSLWDWLHGTIRSADPATVPIGLSSVPAPTSLRAMLALPFRPGLAERDRASSSPLRSRERRERSLERVAPSRSLI